jgi:Rhodopirellula transposase DDE domain
VVKQLQALVEDTTAGDPVSGLRWTHKSTRKLAKALGRLGFRISAGTVGRLLKAKKYSLRTNRKRLARTHEPERDRQFRYIARQRRRFQKQGNPAISIDTKKKELVGLFKNPGRSWRRQAIDVRDHDFASLASGRGVPFGIYEAQRQTGFVVVGTSSETAAFVANALSTWWAAEGRRCHPQSKHWFVEADCGGGNNPRVWAWKWELQQLANRWDVTITVAHYPPGASKWNPIEHRLFSHISHNWQGEPLRDYDTMLNFIRHTTTETGLRCRAVLDSRQYPTKVQITAEQKQQIRLKKSKVLPQWNYTIFPKTKRPSYF